MSDDLRQELLAAFGIEHQEHLQAIRAALAAVESGQPFDLRDVFRRAHSLKGAARAVDLPAVEEMAHRLETVFSRVGEGGLTLGPETLAAIQLGLDGIEGHVAALQGGAPSEPPRAAEQALDRLLGREEAPPEQAVPAAPAPLPVSPLPEAPAAAEAGGAAVEYLRVNAGQVESLAGAVQALAEALEGQAVLGGELRALEAEIRGLRRAWEARPREAAAGGRARDFERDLTRLQRHVTRLGREQRGRAWDVEAALGALRQRVERITLVPAEAVLGSLGRMARELVREAGREAAVRLEGLDLQVDRRVLQALKDPATHLLRNAVSHGLDGPEERAARSKPAEAEIGLRLATRGGLLVLTVFDDGHGPDLERIEAVAVQRGLLPPRTADQPPPPPDRVLSLVFEPGFSTSLAVDRLSGRGMGLSVVAETARRLRGSATLRPRRPWGAEIEIAVPLSAAREPVLLFGAGGQTYGLPSRGIERLLRLRTTAVETVEGKPVLRIEAGGRDVIAPMIALPNLLGQAASPIPVEDAHVTAVLLRSGERRCALAVDALYDVRTLMVDAVDAPGLEGDLVVGAVPLGTAAPALVLSPEGLVGRWLRDEGRLAAAGLGLLPAQETREAATILVVDDSITTRTLEKSILEAQGFRVLLSVDGLDALNRLRGGEALVDLIVADVEMPRMDGFSLLQALKNDPRLAPIPVILMTSRASSEDMRRGLELGAGAYITKQKFDQRELLATIGQML
ncbi:hybrid sensor histidine kinase/response regulator [Roseomonas sp. M0104]|uniref:Chemotaxis protein CheA n=1 Tax=Teichococcus coralli TaxID=2545983 RepID=A0A845BG70_9PROT|nr:response regulator [Pseudoroseomonas coralli]MXP64347.1 hybrid sensor histidine kinase/response regulator [Pseudoroseomonas coralli]